MIILETVWGADNGMIEPGCKCCYWYKYQVMAMISLNTVRMRCPILSCPTKDNVRVNLDVGINFHIGRGPEHYEEDGRKFFYNFGPNRLEELLVMEVEEAIRSFVKTIKVMRIRDVKSEMTTSVLKLLYAKFINYGVVLELINIMAVVLPNDLRIALNDATNYDVFLQKQVKQHKYTILKNNYDEQYAILTLQRNNMQEM